MPPSLDFSFRSNNKIQNEIYIYIYKEKVLLKLRGVMTKGRESKAAALRPFFSDAA
jgi:hypothetical protein